MKEGYTGIGQIPKSLVNRDRLPFLADISRDRFGPPELRVRRLLPRHRHHLRSRQDLRLQRALPVRGVPRRRRIRHSGQHRHQNRGKERDLDALFSPLSPTRCGLSSTGTFESVRWVARPRSFWTPCGRSPSWTQETSTQGSSSSRQVSF